MVLIWERWIASALRIIVHSNKQTQKAIFEQQFLLMIQKTLWNL